ncbi:MAG TPA: hypothetical protein VM165_03180 [Planctomycetaceae bacterium]|nr:hypothetical protein [Planctomycetaceae bacterium]
MRWCVCLAGLVLVASAMTADSQVVTATGPRGNTVSGVGYGGGWWGGAGANFSSTPAEGYARGMSEVIRAQGDAYEAATRGAINYEQARASYMENKLRWHEISLQREQMGEQRRAEYAASQRAARERRQASNTEKPPELLSDGQYDRTTGTAHWPELLATEAFSAQRAKLDEALKVKAHTGENFQVNQQIINLTQDLQTLLKARIRDVPPSTYLEARKFLDQLAREARMGMG